MDNAEGLRLAKTDLNRVSDAEISRFYDADSGGYFISFRKHDVDVVFKHAANSATRKRLYTANDKKLEGNIVIFREVILRRDSNARLLGYPSHAASRLEKRVAKTTAWVHHFLDQLQDTLLPREHAEMELLLARKKPISACLNSQTSTLTSCPRETLNSILAWRKKSFSWSTTRSPNTSHFNRPSCRC